MATTNASLRVMTPSVPPEASVHTAAPTLHLSPKKGLPKSRQVAGGYVKAAVGVTETGDGEGCAWPTLEQLEQGVERARAHPRIGIGDEDVRRRSSGNALIVRSRKA